MAIPRQYAVFLLFILLSTVGAALSAPETDDPIQILLQSKLDRANLTTPSNPDTAQFLDASLSSGNALPKRGWFTNLTKRVDTDTYQAAIDLGAKLLCLFPMSQADAQVANKGKPLEAASYLQTDELSTTEGWESEGDQMDAADSQILSEAFTGIPIIGELVQQKWVHTKPGTIYPDPAAPALGTIPEPNGIITGATFFDSFVPEAGVIIADSTLSVNYKMIQKYGKDWKSQAGVPPVTHIQQFSDAVWLQWLESCQQTGNDPKNINYIIRKWVSSKTVTLQILFQALMNAYGGNPTIGTTWDSRLTLTPEKNPNEFSAVLGSPHGSGAGYILVTHKVKLGLKKISQVDIYAALEAFTVTGSGEDEAEEGEDAQIVLVFTVEPI